MNILKFLLPIFAAFMGHSLYFRRNATNMFATMIQPFSSYAIEDGGGSEHEQEELLQKVKMSAKEAVDNAIEKFEEKISQANKGNLTIDEFNAFKEQVKEDLNSEKLTQNLADKVHTKHAEILDILEKQGHEIERFKVSGDGMAKEKNFRLMTRKQQFEVLLRKSLETDEFKNWSKKEMVGHTQKMNIKAVIGLASDHTGDTFVTEPSNNVRDIPRTQPHMRDYLFVGETDETKITFPEITDYTDIYTLGAQMLTENEEITDVSFKSEEETSEVVRMGVSMNVSKRYFRGRSKVIIDHIIAQIPDAMLFKEDVQILHGDGTGVNLNGIITDARSFDLSPVSYTAGDFTSIASYKSGDQTLVTFASAHGLLSGDKLTIANSTNYNATHEEIILVDETKVIINEAYTAESTAAWTGSGISYWYQSIDDAQEFDVLSAASAKLEAGLYRADLIFLNPQTVKRISVLKAADMQYVGVTRDAAGNLNIDGVPIVSMPVIPAGWFLIGDFSQKNIEIRDYSTMGIQFLEDVTTKRTNAVVVLADQELHLVKYNPNWYIYDRFSTSITQVKAPE